MSGKSLKKKSFVLILVIVVLIAGVAIGYSIRGNEERASEEEIQSVSEDSVQNVQENNEQEYITINTEYGDLYYPQQWEDYLVTEQELEGESLIVSFSAQINETEYPMFQVTVGGDSDGTEVGELTDSSGTKRMVYMKVEEMEVSDELTENEQQRLYAMQEDLNCVIDNLK